MIKHIPDNITYLYMDFETSSGDPKLDSVNPFHNCTPIGAGVTWDDNPEVYFIKHSDCGKILPQLLCVSKYWVNHNVKYDAHVYCNSYGKLPNELQLVCTVVGSKLIDSNLTFTGGYSLDNVAKRFLHEDITHAEKDLQPYLYRNKDYGGIPLDLLSTYCCLDVAVTRRLHRYICDSMPSDCADVWETEQRLTKILVDMEQYGMCIDLQNIRVTHLKYMYQMLKLEQELQELTGRQNFRPHTNADCAEVLCGVYGAPIVEWTEGGQPSFNKYSLALYLDNPDIPKGVIQRIIRYRKLATAISIFIEPYQALHLNGILHPSYNQTVRTGRMSCSDPNLQQIDKTAKLLVVPREGNCFLEFDLSQIELRVIVHYIKDEKAIAAYNDNPDTDFHNLSSELCDISRQSAKTLNFAAGYGAGKKRILRLLTASKSGQDPEIVYNRYHATFPTLKSTAREAAGAAYHRGYVRDWYGRRRHLPPNVSHLAFNTICQASAASMIKERIVAIHDLIRSNNWNIKMVAIVHDSLLFEGSEEDINNTTIVKMIKDCLESPTRPLRVPIRSNYGISATSWAETITM